MVHIDDVGLLTMDRAAAFAFHQVVNLRYEKQHSTIVTTNRGLPDWGEIFGDTVVAAAILDRLMHEAVMVNTPTGVCSNCATSALRLIGRRSRKRRNPCRSKGFAAERVSRIELPNSAWEAARRGRPRTADAGIGRRGCQWCR
ncbi:MAG: ATP-binding protein [Actinobacteria bacterium]|nr:ATP-binding protein [Actinomycetota bacterium]